MRFRVLVENAGGNLTHANKLVEGVVAEGSNNGEAITRDIFTMSDTAWIRKSLDCIYIL